MSNQATINGQPVSVLPGETILDTARRHEFDIPTLCSAPELKPEGGCRLCLVQCESEDRPVAACHTEMQDGMVIQTNTPEIESIRRTILTLYEQTGERTGFSEASLLPGHFADLLRTYRLDDHLEPGEPTPTDESHTYLRFQADACITCRLCLNACEQIQGQFVYGIENRGSHTRLVFGADDDFAESTCVACGACVDVCPTGAISDIDRITLPRNLEHTHTVCGYCGVGCRINVASKDNRVKQIDPIEDAAVNRGHLCVKGRYAHAWHHSGDRLTKPLIRENGDFREATWDEALQYIADRLVQIAKESGPDSLGAFTSSRSTNEACYLLQKLFRSVIRTNNVDCCARVCHSSTALALQLVTGTGAASASYTDFEKASCIVVAGANPTEAHPVAGARIKQAALDGVPLIVIDPRRIEMAEYADSHLQLLPGSNVALFNGLAKVMIEESLANLEYLKQRTEGLDELVRFLSDLSLKEISSITGVTEEEIASTARLIARG